MQAHRQRALYSIFAGKQYCCIIKYLTPFPLTSVKPLNFVAEGHVGRLTHIITITTFYSFFLSFFLSFSLIKLKRRPSNIVQVDICFTISGKIDEIS